MERYRYRYQLQKTYKMYNDVKEELFDIMNNAELLDIVFKSDEVHCISKEEYEKFEKIKEEIVERFEKRGVLVNLVGNVKETENDYETKYSMHLNGFEPFNILSDIPYKLYDLNGRLSFVFDNLHLLHWGLGLRFDGELKNNHLFDEFDLLGAYGGLIPWCRVFEGDEDLSLGILKTVEQVNYKRNGFKRYFNMIPLQMDNFLYDSLHDGFFNKKVETWGYEDDWNEDEINVMIESFTFEEFFLELGRVLSEITILNLNEGTYQLTKDYKETMKELTKEDTKYFSELAKYMG